MFRGCRDISFRLFVALLALAVVAFPAAAPGMAPHCQARHSLKQGGEPPHDCCSLSDAESGHDEDADAPTKSGCAACPHACCRPAVQVVPVRLSLLLDGEVVASVVLPAESVHDAITCAAIFHPPRA